MTHDRLNQLVHPLILYDGLMLDMSLILRVSTSGVGWDGECPYLPMYLTWAGTEKNSCKFAGASLDNLSYFQRLPSKSRSSWVRATGVQASAACLSSLSNVVLSSPST